MQVSGNPCSDIFWHLDLSESIHFVFFPKPMGWNIESLGPQSIQFRALDQGLVYEGGPSL